MHNKKFAILIIFKCTIQWCLSTFTVLCSYHHYPFIELSKQKLCMCYIFKNLDHKSVFHRSMVNIYWVPSFFPKAFCSYKSHLLWGNQWLKVLIMKTLIFSSPNSKNPSSVFCSFLPSPTYIYPNPRPLEIKKFSWESCVTESFSYLNKSILRPGIILRNKYLICWMVSPVFHMLNRMRNIWKRKKDQGKSGRFVCILSICPSDVTIRRIFKLFIIVVTEDGREYWALVIFVSCTSVFFEFFLQICATFVIKKNSFIKRKELLHQVL